MAKPVVHDFEIADARLEGVPVWLGIAGPSSSGKTFSALTVATGMQDIKGGDIGVIDTEHKRATHYARQFKFKHLNFRPPFSQERYLAAVRKMASVGVKIIVIDSMSHEHEGEGGYLMQHKANLDERVRRALEGNDTRPEYKIRDAMNFTAWIEPAAARTFMVGEFLQLDVSLIFCFRAKEKLKIKTGGKPETLGYMPIAGDELVYNCAALAILPPRSMGVPDWEAKGCKINSGMGNFFPIGKPLSRETGRILQRWARGDDNPLRGDTSPQQQHRQVAPTQQREQSSSAPVEQQRDTPAPDAEVFHCKTCGQEVALGQQHDCPGLQAQQQGAPTIDQQAADRSLKPLAEFKGVRAFWDWSAVYLDRATAEEAKAWRAEYQQTAMPRMKELNADKFNDFLDLLSSAERGAMDPSRQKDLL